MAGEDLSALTAAVRALEPHQRYLIGLSAEGASTGLTSVLRVPLDKVPGLLSGLVSVVGNNLWDIGFQTQQVSAGLSGLPARLEPSLQAIATAVSGMGGGGVVTEIARLRGTLVDVREDTRQISSSLIGLLGHILAGYDVGGLGGGGSFNIGSPGSGGLLDWHGPVTVDMGKGWKDLFSAWPDEAKDFFRTAVNATKGDGEQGPVGPAGGGAAGSAGDTGESWSGGMPGAGQSPPGTRGGGGGGGGAREVPDPSVFHGDIDRMKSHFLNVFGLKSGRPSDGPSNCAFAYGLTTVLGAAASCTAALFGSTVVGTGAVGMGNVAKVLGEMAGYGPVNQAIIGAISDGFLATPMSHYAKDIARPTLPGIGDVLRLYWKRLLSDSPEPRTAFETTYDTKQVLAYHGLDDKWIKVLLNDASAEPSVREIVSMEQVALNGDDWLQAKLRRLLFSEPDVVQMKDILSWRSRQAVALDRLRQHRAAFIRGYETEEMFEPRLEEIGYPEAWREHYLDAARTERNTRHLDATVENTVKEWSAGITKPEHLKTLLVPLIVDEEVRTRTVQAAVARRYKVVTLYSEDGKVADYRATLRRMVLLGLRPIYDYQLALDQLGVVPDVRDRELALLTTERMRQQAADVRSFNIPAMLDDVLTGQMSESDFNKALRDLGVDPGHQEAQVATASVLKRWRQEGRLQKWEIGPLKTAFVNGIIGRDALVEVLKAAGLAAREIAAILKGLDRLVKVKAANDKVKAGRMMAAAKQKEEKEAADASRDAAKAAQGIVKAAKALVKSKSLDVAERLDDLLAQLESTYDLALALMPDAIWVHVAKLRDVLEWPDGPNVDLVSATLDDLAAALDAAAAAPTAAGTPKA